MVALQKRRIAAADARGLAMIVDPGLDEAYFVAADEVSFEQELELGATIYVEEDYIQSRGCAPGTTGRI